VLQTTNNILDASLYRLLTPHTLTSWQRVRVANMLSATGAAARARRRVECNTGKAGGIRMRSMLL
jgi:Phospholipase B